MEKHNEAIELIKALKIPVYDKQEMFDQYMEDAERYNIATAYDKLKDRIEDL